MNLKARMYISYAVVIILTGIIGLFSLYSMDKVNSRLNELGTERVPRLVLMSDIDKELSEYVAAQRNVMLRPASNEGINEMQNAEQIIDKNLTELHETAIPTYKDRIASTISLWQDYKKLTNDRVKLFKSGQNMETDAVKAQTDKVRQVREQLNGEMKKYIEETNAATVKNVSDGQSEYTKSKIMTGVGLLIAIIIGMAIATVVTRYMSKFINAFLLVSQKVSDGDLKQKIEFTGTDEFGEMASVYNKTIENIHTLVRTIQSTAGNVANTVSQVASGADQSANAIQHIAQSVTVVAQSADKQSKGISQSTQDTANITNYMQAVSSDARAAADDAEKALNTANEGTQIMFSTIEQMKQIEETTRRSSDVISALGDRSKEIGQIVDTISGLAGQTNLLALNAAIEAARAGEQGKGFAVVAEEVRKLAEQSQQSAQQIAGLIGRIQKETQEAVDAISSGTGEVQAGMESVNKSGEAFSNIMQIAASVAMQVREMSETMDEVAKNGDNILSRIREVDKETKVVADEMENTSASTEEQTASLEEISASCQNLQQLTDKLLDETKKFRI
ncbi:methyl-accepting chemotaxis protein [Pectinatus haikarae]|uniref:Methyl-accepting chemotaxis protein n=1 Tax=Pectinatus haikarae TaxID=349096 RepID=A0ABT9Y705_9FIRM|nr:HAMP domain-containing methyl-accepting chemotaxis protein [Pectinatus haikarae]MDQ0202934.1 methyl-accepting chemotaxis protein [Pectinatus haikarae]